MLVIQNSGTSLIRTLRNKDTSIMRTNRTPSYFLSSNSSLMYKTISVMRTILIRTPNVVPKIALVYTKLEEGEYIC